MSAYQQMIPADSFPLYVLFIDLDPAQIDINVHPTKQEIKFEDEKIVYAFVQAAVKHALAQFSITPTLDFELDPSIQQLDAVNKPFTDEQKTATASSNIYQAFTQKHQAHFVEPSQKSELRHWKDFYERSGGNSEGKGMDVQTTEDAQQSTFSIQHTSLPLQLLENSPLTQLMNTYIVASTNRGFILIHQQLAHERILYERYSQAWQGKTVATQRSLFPVTLQLATSDAVLLQDLLPDLQQLGYQIELFGKDAFVIQGTPADLEPGNEKVVIEKLLEQFKHFSSDVKLSRREKLIRSLTWQHAIKPGTSLMEKEMKVLAEELFDCMHPNTTAGGNPTYIEFRKEYVEKMFGR
jgi:DNA mismatch repair protein MutL